GSCGRGRGRPRLGRRLPARRSLEPAVRTDRRRLLLHSRASAPAARRGAAGARAPLPGAIHVKRAFVIGHPIAHSRSPLIHGHWLAQYGIAGSYEAIDVAPDGLGDFFGRLRSGEFVGGNVTVPHKEMACALVDSRDPETAHIGAFNTLVAKPGPEGIAIHG